MLLVLLLMPSPLAAIRDITAKVYNLIKKQKTLQSAIGVLLSNDVLAMPWSQPAYCIGVGYMLPWHTCRTRGILHFISSMPVWLSSTVCSKTTY